MSAMNGDKSRYQINRKRRVLRRVRIREMVAAGSEGQKRPAHAKLRPAKGVTGQPEALTESNSTRTMKVRPSTKVGQ